MKISKLTPPNEILKELGRRLKKERKRQNYSQDDFAGKAGIGVATLRRIEKGEQSQIGNWIKIQYAFGRHHVINDFLPEEIKSPRLTVIKTKKDAFEGIKRKYRTHLIASPSKIIRGTKGIHAIDKTILRKYLDNRSDEKHGLNKPNIRNIPGDSKSQKQSLGMGPFTSKHDQHLSNTKNSDIVKVRRKKRNNVTKLGKDL